MVIALLYKIIALKAIILFLSEKDAFLQNFW